MNTIIVPTDFSAAAEHATAYAAQLAQKTDASVLLLHVYQLPVPMTEFPVMMVSASDLKNSTDAGLQRALEEARKRHTGVSFEMQSRLGDVATEIGEACNEQNPLAVIVGTKELSGFERFLFGDTTLSLVKNLRHPVIAVPENASISAPANIVLATDLLNERDIPAGNIVAITKVLDATLHVVHVESTESKHYPDELMAAFAGVNASYHAIKEDDVTEGIRHYVEQNNIDMVIVLPHKHSLYERLFFKGHTPGILHTMPVPVMSIRND